MAGTPVASSSSPLPPSRTGCVDDDDNIGEIEMTQRDFELSDDDEKSLKGMPGKAAIRKNVGKGLKKLKEELAAMASYATAPSLAPAPAPVPLPPVL